MKLKIWKAKDGWRWNAKAGNNKIVAESGEAYTRRRDCLRAVIQLGLCATRIVMTEAGKLAPILLVALLFAGCTSTQVGIKDGQRTLNRVSILQKAEIGDVDLNRGTMGGYKNDGGVDAIKGILAIAMQYMGLQAELQAARYEAQISELSQRIEEMKQVPPAPAPAPPVVIVTNAPPVPVPPSDTNAPSGPTDNIP